MLQVLRFLNLLDESDSISLTNCALIAMTVKIVLSDKIDWPSAIAVASAFANYAHKRSTISKDVK